MTSHADHPDSHENGLADDCPRCAEHAANPISTLDDRNLQLLVQRTLSNRFGYGGEHLPPRSNTEAVAMAQVTTALEHAGRIAAVSPRLLATYILDRWHVPLDAPLEKLRG